MSPISGVQQLTNHGLLPSSLNQTVLKSASASQLNKMAASSIALQETATLLGTGDSATLSPTATSASSTGDPLMQAINNALTSSLNAAVSKFLPQNPPTTGSQINLLA